MRALWNLTLVELKLFLREPSAAFFTLALPVLLLVLNGASASAGPDAADRLLPGYVAMVIATAGITVLPGVLASYREKGVLRRYRVTPVAPTVVLGAQLVLQVLVATLGLAILVAVGVAVVGMAGPVDPLGAVAGYLAGILGISAIGFLLAAILPNSRTAEAVSLALYLPMIFVSGAVFPREALPDLARTIGEVLPLAFVVDALSSPWNQGVTDWGAIGILLGITLVATGVATRMFRWQ
jgi:ABC-2 type transport system permease protein